MLKEKTNQNSSYLTCKQKQILYNQLTEYLTAIENYSLAIINKNKANNLTCNEEKRYSITSYHLANLYLANNQTDSAKIIMSNNINLIISAKDSFELIGAYNQCGLICSSLKEYVESNEYFLKAINVIKKTDHRKLLEPVLLGNMGYNYKMLGNTKKAYEYLSLDAKESLKNNVIEAYINAEFELASIDFDQKKLNKTIKRSLNLLTNYNEKIPSFLKYQTQKLLSNAYAQNNETAKALEYFKNHSILKDSLINTRTNKYQSLLNEYSKYIHDKIVEEKNQRNQLAEKDIALLKNEKKITSQRINFLIFLLLLTALIIFLVFKRINDSKKKKAILVENELILKKQHLRLKSTEKKLLELQIANDNKKINSLALELNVKSNFSDLLMKQLEKLDKFSFSELKNIELFVQNELDLKSNRAKLQEDIESIGNNFFKALDKKHKDLNESELKLCSLIVLNLSNKEIAISKNIGHNSVKISKNRLKKKLNLNTETDLKEYLQQFLSN